MKCINKDNVEMVAIILAGGFFLFQVFDGWLFSNLKISLSSQRVESSAVEDTVAINVKLEKGLIGSVFLKNIIICSNCSKPKERGIDTSKFAFDDEGFITSERTFEPVALSSGDLVSFSEVFKVDKGSVCIFQVIVGSQRNLSDNPQWFSSIASLPLEKKLTRP